LNEVVEFSGALPHERIVEVYQRADVMLNTSKTGSIDKAVLEAMACALPVVTSNEAFRVMLAPWGDLLAVPPDSPDALASSLRRIQVMPPEERAALGRGLREIVVREHSLDALVKNLIRIFRTREPGTDIW
jgi:glycosyltransferase involved in cell wall biosynthesis